MALVAGKLKKMAEENTEDVHDRTENVCTVSTFLCPIQALEKFSKALYGTTEGTYSARVFRPVMS